MVTGINQRLGMAIHTLSLWFYLLLK